MTRALRNRLAPTQEANMTLRQRKRNAHFPQRKFAVKA